jgi:hypothetical protein
LHNIFARKNFNISLWIFLSLFLSPLNYIINYFSRHRMSGVSKFHLSVPRNSRWNIEGRFLRGKGRPSISLGVKISPPLLRVFRTIWEFNFNTLSSPTWKKKFPHISLKRKKSSLAVKKER